MSLDKNPWQTKASKEIYNNPWIRLVENQVINPKGGEGIYGVVHFKNVAIAVIPIDKEGFTYLVGQYRYTLNSYEWEIPMGGGPKENSNLASAKRELLEETGIVAAKWELILNSQVSNSVTDEISVSYVATDLSYQEAIPEDTEQLQIRKVKIEEAIRMAMDGEIRDLISIASLLKLKILLENNLISF